jgi:hypothetical protein
MRRISQIAPAATSKPGAPAPTIGPGTTAPLAATAAFASAKSPHTTIELVHMYPRIALSLGFHSIEQFEVSKSFSRRRAAVRGSYVLSFARLRIRRTSQIAPAATSKPGAPAPTIGPGTLAVPARAVSVSAKSAHAVIKPAYRYKRIDRLPRLSTHLERLRGQPCSLPFLRLRMRRTSQIAPAATSNPGAPAPTIGPGTLASSARAVSVSAKSPHATIEVVYRYERIATSLDYWLPVDTRRFLVSTGIF